MCVCVCVGFVCAFLFVSFGCLFTQQLIGKYNTNIAFYRFYFLKKKECVPHVIHNTYFLCQSTIYKYIALAADIVYIHEYTVNSISGVYMWVYTVYTYISYIYSLVYTQYIYISIYTHTTIIQIHNCYIFFLFLVFFFLFFPFLVRLLISYLL